MDDNVYVYDLAKEIEYSRDGDFVKTAIFEFKAPSMSCFKEASRLSQLVMRALIDAQGAIKQDDSVTQEQLEQTMDLDAVRMLLFMSKSVDFENVAEVFKDLAIKVGTTDGKTPLTKTLFEKLDIDDFIGVICGYVANFTMPLLLSNKGA